LGCGDGHRAAERRPSYYLRCPAISIGGRSQRVAAPAARAHSRPISRSAWASGRRRVVRHACFHSRGATLSMTRMIVLTGVRSSRANAVGVSASGRASHHELSFVPPLGVGRGPQVGTIRLDHEGDCVPCLGWNIGSLWRAPVPPVVRESRRRSRRRPHRPLRRPPARRPRGPRRRALPTEHDVSAPGAATADRVRPGRPVSLVNSVRRW
jgi:hypothetical protein